MKKLVILFMIVVLAIFSFSTKKYQFKKSRLKGNIYKIEIGTVNLIALIGEEGILLSDSGFKDSGKDLEVFLKTISQKPVKTIINTHWHHDHCGGNFYFHPNVEIIAHQNTKKLLQKDRISEFWKEEYKAFPEYALPDLTFTGSMKLFFEEEEIELISYPGGHTSGDIIVCFKKSGLVHLGDLLFSFGFPAIDFENGGSVPGYIKNLGEIIKIIPKNSIIAAGHGPEFTVKELIEYKNMLQKTMEIINKKMTGGFDLKQIQKVKPLENYKKWSDGYFSTDDWIEIVYSSLIHQTKISEKF